MVPVQPSQVEGYAEAVSREAIIRDSAFLGQPETVAGFELRQMLLKDYLLLRLMACPLLWGGAPSPKQLNQFLWVMSTSYPDNMAMFNRRCVSTFYPPDPPLFHFSWLMKRWKYRHTCALGRAAEVIQAVQEYIAETLQDKPQKPKKPGNGKVYYSSAAYWCATMAREYGYSLEAVMNMPLKIIFQLMNEIRESKGLEVCNPSDAIVAEARARQMAVLNASLIK